MLAPPTTNARPLPPWVRGTRAAFVFFTRLPVGGFPYAEQDFCWAAGWFPGVGAVVGTVVATVWASVASESRLGPWLAAVLALSVSMLLTGALHEDGLADTADALGGMGDRARIFEILKDSRIGTYGACALILSTSLRLSALVQLHARVGNVAGAILIVLAAMLSRTAPVWLMTVLPYVSPREEAKSAAVTRAGRPQALVATTLAVVATAVAIVLGALQLSAAALIFCGLACLTAILGGWFHRRAGGLTGDFLGTVVITSECLVLLVALLMSAPRVTG